jgi:hypothetical protein
MLEGRRECEGLNGYIAEVCCDGFPSTSAVIAFKNGEEELEGTTVSLIPRA